MRSLKRGSTTPVACCTTNSSFARQEAYPYSGDYHGPQGFFELFMKINDVLELTPDPAIQYLLADDTVAMHYRLTFTSRASGKSVEMGVVEVFSIRDGLIVELDVFYRDPSAVTALLEA